MYKYNEFGTLLEGAIKRSRYGIFVENIVDIFQQADIQDGRKELTWI
jgi:hypothetical protein